MKNQHSCQSIEVTTKQPDRERRKEESCKSIVAHHYCKNILSMNVNENDDKTHENANNRRLTRLVSLNSKGNKISNAEVLLSNQQACAQALKKQFINKHEHEQEHVVVKLEETTTDSKRTYQKVNQNCCLLRVYDYFVNLLLFRNKLKSDNKKEEAKQIAKEDDNDDDDDDGNNVDSGYAWIILAVMFVINASTFGTARAYGLIFEKLAREHNNARTEAALPFTIMGAIENMGGPLTGYLLTKTDSWRITVFIGSCLITLSHFLAAFCKTLTSQILTMGLMCGFGLSFITISSFQINNAYFVRYRSRAFGLGLTGAVFGTFYISPICQYVLNNSKTTSKCYLMLSLILLPNVPLSLLLKPKKIKTTTNKSCQQQQQQTIKTISDQVNQKQQQRKQSSIWFNIKKVLKTPLFHLIWPTQLLFCWFNFVFGMIIVDFSKDRGLDCDNGAHLITIWAFGQLTGRTILGSFVDLKIVSYKLFTIICFLSISLSTWILNNVRPNDSQYQEILLSLIVFILSMFISNLYILFNGLILNYMEKSLTPLSLGISSFTSSFFLLPRANVIGYYRDTIGNYDSMLTLFTYISLIAATVWFLLPQLFEYRFKQRKQEQLSLNLNQNKRRQKQLYF